MEREEIRDSLKKNLISPFYSYMRDKLDGSSSTMPHLEQIAMI
jgi:hypothetical protein